MTRINTFRTTAEPSSKEQGSVAWGKTASALVFAAVLIVCSVTVGCSSDKPKPVSSNNQISVPQAASPVASTPAPVMQAETKPAPKKPVVHKKPATVNYTDKTTGVTFEYPRRYAIETGDAATELLAANPIPMNFVSPGGVALAAVELPESNYSNTDFSSAFFDVSVHKTLTADQCTEFAVPLPKVAVVKEVIASDTKAVVSSDVKPATDIKPATEVKSDTTTQASTEAAKPASDAQSTAQPAVSNSATTASSQPEPQGSKLMLGDLELHGTEAVTGEGTRQSDSKYFHVYQNGSCYEFALNVTTDASGDGMTKHVDRDKVFNRLEQILSTVKINPVTPEVAAEAPAPTPAPATPAQ